MALYRRVMPQWAVLGVFSAVSVAALGARGEPQFEFTAFDFPGAIYTEASGINPSGDVVGLYYGGGAYHGFVLRNGEFASIDYPQQPGGPAVIRTQAGGINPQGDIVGSYRLYGERGYVWHAFLLTRHGEFRNIDVPGWYGTLATAILPDGTIVGCVHNTDMTTSMHGFVRDPEGVVSVVEHPGTMFYGATPDLATIVGRYIDTSTPPPQQFGLVLDQSGINYFRFPESTFTQAWNVNPRGEIVGYFNRQGVLHGFLKNGDEFTAIDYPGASGSYALGINASGDLVGGFTDAAGAGHAFIGRRTN